MNLSHTTTEAQDAALQKLNRRSNPDQATRPTNKVFAESLIAGYLDSLVAEDKAARKSARQQALDAATPEQEAAVEAALGISNP